MRLVPTTRPSILARWAHYLWVEMLTCIYCTRNQPPEAFDTEHVLPQAFGHFRDALTLHDTVCKECNSYFGRTLDRWLGRESAEGLERYRWGIKPPDDVINFQGHRVRMSAEGLGEYEGLILQPIPGVGIPGEGIQVAPAPQIGFARADGAGWKWVPLDELRDGSFLRDTDIEVLGPIKLIPASCADELLAALARHGVNKHREGDFELPVESGGPLDVLSQFSIDDDIRRSLAKIAFNYFASAAGSDEALKAAYDPIRRYVRYGREPFLPIVRSNVPRIFRHEREAQGEDPVVHYLAITRDRRSDVLFCQLSLVGWMAHNVTLRFSISDDVRDLRVGHLFNIADLTVSALTAFAPEDVAVQAPWLLKDGA